MRLMWLIAAAALLAGCTQADDPAQALDPADPRSDQLPDGSGDTSEPANGFAPQEGRYEEHAGDLSIVVVLEPCEAGHCITAVATNEGVSDLHVSDICVGPFSDAMAQADVLVQHREAAFHCEAFGTEVFPPGAQLSWSATWDEQVWSDDGPGPAPQGSYDWTVSFRAYAEAEGGEPLDVEATFPVVVGAT